MEQTTSVTNRRSRNTYSKKSSTASLSKKLKPNNIGRLTDENKDDIDQVLLSNGFAPIARIHMGTDKITFVKSFTDLGHMCYVQLDTDKPIYREKDLSLVKVENIYKEPVKNGQINVEDCVKLEVCGIAYECNEGICVLKRDYETLDLKEDLFTVTEASSLKYGGEQRTPLAYPIVLYSEIIANKVAVMWNISRMTFRLKHKAIHNYNISLMEIRQSFFRLNESANTLLDSMHKARDNVIGTSSELHKARDAYTLPVDNDHIKQYGKIIGGLHTCEDLVGDLILTSRNLNMVQKDIDSIAEFLKTTQEEITSRYSHQGC